MKTINLLPVWYIDQRKQRRNLRLHLAVKLIIGLCMLGAITVGRQRLSVLELQRRNLDSQFAGLGDPTPSILKFSAELRRLDELKLAYRELGNTIPMSAVIQQIQNSMTPGMALSQVVVDVRAEPVKGSGFVGDLKNPPRYHDVAHITVVGITPGASLSDSTILFDGLSRNPLFADVSVNYTRNAILKGYTVRQFELQLQMDLERLIAEAPDTTTVNAVAPSRKEANDAR